MSTVPASIPAKNSSANAVYPVFQQDLLGQAAGSMLQPASAVWQKELASAIRNSNQLLSKLGFAASVCTDSPTSQAGEMPSDSGFPVFVTESFVSRMIPNDPKDPLLLQVLPGFQESLTVPGFTSDAVGDLQARIAPGLLQKYAGRALLIATGACAIHCRYCFRREYPYHEDPRTLNDWEPAIEQLSADPSISEVILSGGDPLMLTDARLRTLCERLSQIPHIERLRFHSRLPVVLPSRVTPELLELLQQQRPQVIFVVHTNHAQEIDDSCARALSLLVRSGFPVLNQTVLLKEINDQTDVLERLSRRLTSLGVMPYYLHQLDRVTGTAHFEVPIETGKEIVAELARRLPGYAVPRYVHEIPGEPHKTGL